MDTSPENDPVTGPDHAGVKLPPPLIFLVSLIIGLWWDSPWFTGHLAGWGLTITGGIIAVAGLALVVTSAPRHRKAGSNVEPWKPTTAIITTGLYGFSRNPIYLGMAVTQAGLAICGGSIGALVMLVASIAFTQIYVIAREERYLEAKFGTEYTDYKKKVRRWI